MLLKSAKYRKSHQLYLINCQSAQRHQIAQQKSFDSVILKGTAVLPLRFEEYEALRRILSRKLQRLLRFALIRKPYSLVTAKPREIRMGKGKGAFSHYQLLMTAGAPFARIAWCHRNFLSRFFAVTKTSIKKSAHRFYF